MRACAKPRCREPATAAVGLRYDDRIVVIGDLQARYDPNLLELCVGHADRLTPPRGWHRQDRRREVVEVPEAATLAAAEPTALIPPAGPDALASGALSTHTERASEGHL